MSICILDLLKSEDNEEPAEDIQNEETKIITKSKSRSKTRSKSKTPPRTPTAPPASPPKKRKRGSRKNSYSHSKSKSKSPKPKSRSRSPQHKRHLVKKLPKSYCDSCRQKGITYCVPCIQNRRVYIGHLTQPFVNYTSSHTTNKPDMYNHPFAPTQFHQNDARYSKTNRGRYHSETSKNYRNSNNSSYYRNNSTRSFPISTPRNPFFSKNTSYYGPKKYINTT